MEKMLFEKMLNEQLITEIFLPDGDKIKPFLIHVTTFSFTRHATPEKCVKFGLNSDKAAGGFISGSMGELNGKFLYRQVFDDNFSDKIHFTYLPDEDDDGIPVAKVNFVKKMNPKYAEHVNFRTEEMYGCIFINIRLEF